MLVALGFLAVIMVAAASLFISTAKATDESGKTGTAVLAGRQILEEAQNELRQNPDAVSSQNFWSQEFIVTPWKEEAVVIGNDSYLCRVFTYDVRDTGGNAMGGRPENMLKRIRVEVSWQQGEGQGYGTLKTELVTLIAR